MNVRDKIPAKLLQFLSLGLSTSFLAISCNLETPEISPIKIDGSSTVYPLFQLYFCGSSQFLQIDQVGLKSRLNTGSWLAFTCRTYLGSLVIDTRRIEDK
ncbi:MAG: hypothetical protein AB4372_14075 [Xenococcus sp. (in: cyanobacteria)]